MGLFERDHMEFEAQRAADTGGEPSLAEMTRKAIEILQRDTDGYVLMVEGGRIDHAHHAGQAGLALDETVALDAAVKTALSMVNLDETLVIVTSDHSHNLTIAGYPKRGNPILGKVVNVDGTEAKAADGKPYTTLSYANGPGAVRDGPRRDPADEDTLALTYIQPALVPFGGATHGGEDVAVRAIGPWAHLLTGVLEQNLIYHVMAHALQLESR
jgi:alkaline phosphatase